MRSGCPGPGRVVALLCLGLLLPGCRADSDVDTLLRRLERAYGGSAAVEASGRLRIEANVEAHIRQQQGVTRRELLAPDKLRVEVIYSDSSELRLLDGDEAWRGAPESPAPVRSGMREALIYQLLRSWLPGALLAHRARLEDHGSVELDGRKLRLLRLPWSSTLTVDYYVDPDSDLVVRVDGSVEAGPHRIVFSTRFSEFEAHQGVMVPMHEENHVADSHSATTRVVSVTLPGTEELGPFRPLLPASWKLD